MAETLREKVEPNSNDKVSPKRIAEMIAMGLEEVRQLGLREKIYLCSAYEKKLNILGTHINGAKDTESAMNFAIGMYRRAEEIVNGKIAYEKA